MAVDGSLNFDTNVNTKGFSKSVNAIGSQIENLKSTLLKLGAAVGAAFGVKELIGFSKQAIETASDMAEVQNVVDTAFGSMSEKMEDFADTSIKQFGISKLAAKQTGSTFMAMASGMGLAQDSASDMAISLTGLSADMASFYNVEQDVASTALESVFTGETETLKQFGIVMTDANLQAYALSQGISKSTSEMSQAEKVQLRYNYVMSQTALAQGDFAKTSDSWANQTRILSEQWKEFTSVIGSVLVGVLLPAVRTINNALSDLIGWARNAAQAIADVFGIDMSADTDPSGALAADTAELADNADSAADSYSDMAAAAEEAAEAQENSLASFDQITKLGDSSSSSSDTTDSTVTGTLSGGTISTSVDVDISEADKKFKDFFKWVKSSLKTIFDPFKSAWSKNGAKVIDSAKYAWNGLKGLFSSLGTSLETVWSNGTGELYISNILRGWEDILIIIGDVSNAFKNAWDDGGNGTALIQSYFDSCIAWQDLLHTISEDFRDIWNNGTGSEIFTNIIQSLTNINDTVTNLQTNFKNAWSENDTGKGIIQDIFDIFNDILSTINSITEDTKEWAAELDFSPLLTSVKSLLDSIEPLTENIGDGLEWFWNNVLLPMAGFTIEEIIPDFLDNLSSAIDVVTSSVEALKPLGKWLWDNFLEPIASWTGGVIATVLEDVGNGLQTIADIISGKLSFSTLIKDLNGLEIAFGSIAAAIGLALGVKAIGGLIAQFPVLLSQIIAQTSALIANAAAWAAANLPILAVVGAIAAIIAIGVLLYQHWEEVKEFASEIWASIQETLFTFFDWCTEKFNALVEFLSGIWTGIKEVFSAVGEWFTEIFQAAWDGIVSVWEAVTGWFSELWTGIKEVFSAVGSWFSEKFTSAWENIKSAFTDTAQFFKDLWTAIKKPFRKVADWFKDIFSKAWQAVKDVFSTGGKIFDGIKEGISGLFTSVVNKLIDGINVIISKPLEFLNGVLNDIQDIEIAGFTPFDEFWGYDPIPVPQIPKLATGTVVPANYGEFMAILGDNKRETEIVSPLSTMKQALLEALVAYGGTTNENQKISVTIPITLNGKVISQLVIDNINDYIKRNGKSPIKV